MALVTHATWVSRPFMSHVTLTTTTYGACEPPNRSTFSFCEPPNQICLPSLSVNPQTKSVHLLSQSEIAIKPPSQTNKPRNIYTQTHFSWNSREKKSSEIFISVRQKPNTQVLALSLSVYVLIYSQLYIMRRGHNVAFVYSSFGF